jgi:hypothetical protein
MSTDSAPTYSDSGYRTEMFVASNAATDWSADMRPLTTLPPFIKVTEHRGTLSLCISLIRNQPAFEARGRRRRRQRAVLAL